MTRRGCGCCEDGSGFPVCSRCNPTGYMTVTSLKVPGPLLSPPPQSIIIGYQTSELIASPITTQFQDVSNGLCEQWSSATSGSWTNNKIVSGVNSYYQPNNNGAWALALRFRSGGSPGGLSQVDVGYNAASSPGANPGYTLTFDLVNAYNALIPDERTECEKTTFESGASNNPQFYSSITFQSAPDYSLCSWWAGTCDFADAVLTNGKRLLNGVVQETQTGAMYWDKGSTLSDDYVRIPNSGNAGDWRFSRPNDLSVSAGKYIYEYDPLLVSFFTFMYDLKGRYQMNACAGNVTWTNVANSSETFEFTIANSRVCP